MKFNSIEMKAGKAQVLIYSTIGEGSWGKGLTAMSFMEALRDLGPVSEIDVRINSDGGSALREWRFTT